MQNKVLRIVSIVCAIIILVLSLAACGSDPNVKQQESGSESYAVDVGKQQEETQREGYHSYPAGKTDPIKLNGVEVKVTDFAVYGYELQNMMAVKKFASPKELPVDLLAQYAFAHSLYPRLNEANNKPMEYRTIGEAELNASLTELFGKLGVDLTKSVLYQPSKQLFEMWIPAYGCNIYYNIDAVNINGDTADVITTYFNELERSTMLGRATVKVGIEDGKPAIRALSNE